eukprot:254690-Rhodomonas_salina.3
MPSYNGLEEVELCDDELVLRVHFRANLLPSDALHPRPRCSVEELAAGTASGRSEAVEESAEIRFDHSSWSKLLDLLVEVHQRDATVAVDAEGVVELAGK